MESPVSQPRPSATPTRSWRDSPFRLENDAAFHRWRDRKLANYPARATDLIVEVRDPRALTDAESEAVRERCRRSNMAIYASRTDVDDREVVRGLGERFGLVSLDVNLLADEDAISALQVVPEKAGRGYIPYTSRRLLWHTDGYYNAPARRIRAFVLHCVRPAALGGENGLLDPEIAYIRLRDADPRHVAALMDEDAMTIPANTEPGTAIRAVQSGPVFEIDPQTGALHMRYTARTRSIEWKRDEPTRAAVRALESLLAEDSPAVFRHRLEAGQGLVCNNVLHNRTEFADDPARGPRLLYRARYHDRIAGTGPDFSI